jgi:uncharacterized membrane protein YdfJ with MMPL/SSD domain
VAATATGTGARAAGVLASLLASSMNTARSATGAAALGVLVFVFGSALAVVPLAMAAVAIDYSLLLVTRWREELAAGYRARMR